MKKLLHLLTVTAILSFISMNAIAQSGSTESLGDGDDPYIGSVQVYELNIGKTENTRKWYLVDGGTAAEITGTTTWATVTPATTDGGVEKLSITYGAGDFSAKDYVIRYTETSPVASGECSTLRELPITVHVNQFYLTMGVDGADCNVKDGAVINWDTSKDDLVKTTLTYVVDLNKDDDFNLDSWQFKGTFSLPANVTIADGGDVKVTVGLGTGNLSVSGTNNDEFTLTGLTSAQVTITVDVTSKVDIGGGVDLTISEGKALVDSNVTPDNTTLGSGDRSQVITLNALPAATNISFN